MATAASVLGATELMANPIAAEENDSRVKMPQNRAKCPSVGCKPAIGYTHAPKASGKKAPIGSSATSFDVKYGKTPYAALARSLFTMTFSFVNAVRVFINALIAALIAETCNRPIRS